MLATTLGVPFDPNQAWDERKEAYLMSGDIVKTRNMTQTAECGPDALWTTVVAACVYVEYHDSEAATPAAPQTQSQRLRNQEGPSQS